MPTVNQSVGCIALIEGRSMQPTLNPSLKTKQCRDWVFVSKLGISKYQFNRGDVVMLKYINSEKLKLLLDLLKIPLVIL